MFSDCSLQGLHLLLIEDEQDTRELLKFILEAEGAEVTPVVYVYEALAALESNRPDAIVSNVHLPDGDGYSLLEQWRQRERVLGYPAIPAILVTESEREIEQQRLAAAGFQTFITRPFDIESISRIITYAVEQLKQVE